MGDKIDEGYRHSRQVAIGLSATCITISIILLKSLADLSEGIEPIHPYTPMLTKVFLCFVIMDAIFLQYTLYKGLSEEALSYQVEKNVEDNKTFFKEDAHKHSAEEIKEFGEEAVNEVIDRTLNDTVKSFSDTAQKTFKDADWVVRILLVNFVIGAILWALSTRYLF